MRIRWRRSTSRLKDGNGKLISRIYEYDKFALVASNCAAVIDNILRIGPYARLRSVRARELQSLSSSMRKAISVNRQKKKKPDAIDCASHKYRTRCTRT